MGVFKNGVGRPSNETIKKRNIFKGICVLLVLIIAGMTVYILNDKGIINVNNKDDKRAVDNKKDSTKESKKERNISNEEAKKILDNYVLEKYVYGSTGYHDFINLENEYSDNYKTILAISKTKAVTNTYTCKELFGNDIKPWGGIEDNQSFAVRYKETDENNDYGLCFDGNTEFYKLQDVKTEYKKLFGKVSIKQDSVVVNSSNYPIIYGYSNTKKGYLRFSCECGDIAINEINYIYDSYEKNDKLHIIFSYYTYIDNETYDKTIATLTDANGNDIKVNCDGKGNLLENTKDIFEKNKDNAAKFDFVLDKDSSGNYTFESVEKVK